MAILPSNSVRERKQNLRRPLELLYPLETRGWGSFDLLDNNTNKSGKFQEETEKKRQLQISVSVGEDHQKRLARLIDECLFYGTTCDNRKGIL